jgi:hypothetical protein
VLGPHEQRLAEGPALEDVEVLLAADRVVDGEQGLGGGLGHHPDLHLEEVGLGEVLQAVTGRVRGERVEVDGLVDRREVVVEEHRIASLQQLAGPASQLSVRGEPSTTKRSSARPGAMRSDGSSTPAVWKSSMSRSAWSPRPPGSAL